MKKTLLLGLLSLSICGHVHAEFELAKVTWEFQQEIARDFPKCEEYVQGIVDICQLIAVVEKESDRKYYIAMANDFMKLLKKCVKNKKKGKKVVTIGGEFRLAEKK